MRRKSSSARWYKGVLIAVLLAGWLAGAEAYAQSKQRPPNPPQKSVDEFLNPASGPITLAKLLDLLVLVQTDVEPEGRILRGVDARGVDFPMTEENEAKIKSVGASAKLIDLLKLKSPAPPPPPPPPPAPVKVELPSTLRLQCQPGDCEIRTSANSQPLHTHEGTAHASVRAGHLQLEFRKEGYVSQSRVLDITPGSDNAVSVTLEPDADTQKKFGATLFTEMITAAGGDAIQKELTNLSAVGSATLFDSKGNSSDWSLTVTFHADQTTFDAKSAAGSIKIDCRGEICRQVPSLVKVLSKRLSKEQVELMEESFSRFRAYHFGAVLPRLLPGKMEATAKTPFASPAGERRLRLESAAEVYDLTLNSDGLPTALARESKTRPDSGLRLSYSDYAAVGKAQYPRSSEIKSSSRTLNLRVRFDQVRSLAGAK